MKTYSSFYEITETDPEWALKPAKIKFQDVLDPTMDGDYELLKREFLSSTPGLDGIKALRALPVELTNYYTHRLILPFGNFFYEILDNIEMIRCWIR